MNSGNERELVQACLAQKPGAWDRFSKEYRPVLCAAAQEGLRRAGAPIQTADIDEVVQIVLQSLVEGSMQRLASFQGLSRLSTWLSVLAIRTALNYARARRRADPMRILPVFQERFVGSRDDLDELLQGLNAVQRAALRLYFIEGMNRQEIAELLDLSPNSISSLLARSLRLVRVQNPP
jgi:RNA polymerase sigma factor (sigma-70 family)